MLRLILALALASVAQEVDLDRPTQALSDARTRLDALTEDEGGNPRREERIRVPVPRRDVVMTGREPAPAAPDA